MRLKNRFHRLCEYVLPAEVPVSGYPTARPMEEVEACGEEGTVEGVKERHTFESFSSGEKISDQSEESEEADFKKAMPTLSS